MGDTSNSADYLDSRDIVARIEELRDIRNAAQESDANAYDREAWDEDARDELTALEALAEEGETLADWHHGVTLVRDSYFEDYARELAEDIGAVSSDAAWPASYIDWPAAATALQIDYTTIDYDGVTYWARG